MTKAWDVIIRQFGINPDEIAGAGAAGGLGAALTVFLGGQMRSGIETVLNLINFDAPMPLEEALGRAEELYYSGAVRMFRFIKVGMQFSR